MTTQPQPNQNDFTPESLLTDLNPEQKNAVTSGEGPLLVIAGAGTGKTTVITRRVAWLTATGRARPEQILALTFTDKAAGEMEERIDRLMPMGYNDLWVMTFHSFCQRILQEYGLHIGLPNNFRLLSEVDSYLLLRNNFDRFKLDYYRPVGNPTKFVQALLKHFSRAKDEAVTPEEYLEHARNVALDNDHSGVADAEEATSLQEQADAYHTYQQLLHENGYLDFGDLNMFVLRLFKKRPNILTELQARFKYIVVDEFQDTNWAQYELVKMLAGKTRNIAVVGDDDQSIYKFRGASISNILQFKDDFPDSKDVVLTTNYRSLGEILDRAYQFIQLNNPNRLEAKLATPDGGGITKRLVAHRAGHGQVAHLHFATVQDEASQVIKTITEIKASSNEYSWSDFCILVRSHNHADPFCLELERQGVPFQYLALKGLYNKPVILDCIGYLKLLDNHHDSAALYRVLVSPPFNLPAADLTELTHTAENRRGETLYEAIKRRHELLSITPAGYKILDRLMNDLVAHAEIVRRRGVREVVIRFLYDSGYINLLKSFDTAEKQESLSLLKQFVDRIKRYEETHDEPSLKHFIHELELERESGETGSLAFDINTGPDMVRIMTVHSAKGLEFPFVFIVNLVDQRFPTIHRGGEIELPDKLTKEILPDGDIHLEEERRLFYVAMTRAKDGLFLSSAEDYGGKRQKKLSRFLIELGFDRTPLSPSLQVLDEVKPTIKTAAVGDYVPPTSFSYSQLAAYDTCPLQYKFAHVLRLPIFGKAAMSFGKTIHATLEKFMAELVMRDKTEQGNLFGFESSDQKLPLSRDDLMKIYEDCWIDDWYKSKEEREKFRELGRDILKRFYVDATNNSPKPFLLEKDFILKIGGQTFRGKIDRLDESIPGNFEIIDYKTGQPKERLDKEDKRQLLLYQLAATRTLGLKPSKLTFYYLKDGSRQSFIGSDKNLSELEGELEETLNKIITGNFDPNPSAHNCKHCDFSKICEFKAKYD